MNFELGQKIKETKVIWECKTGICVPFEVEEEWVVTDILFNGDIILGEFNGIKKVLHQSEPYVVGCNEPTFFITCSKCGKLVKIKK